MTINWQISHHSRIDSTQSAVIASAENGAPEGTGVMAGVQESGRGRHNRKWESPPGNLYVSFVLRPENIARARIGQLAIVTGVSIAKAIGPHLQNPDRLSLKWPNDIWLDGLKGGGVLINADSANSQHINWAVIGIGMNIANAPLPEAAALNDYLKTPIAPEKLCSAILASLEHYYRIWSEEGFGPVRDDWLKFGFEDGRAITVKNGQEKISGQYRGIDDMGNLRLETDEGIRTVGAGEVMYAAGG